MESANNILWHKRKQGRTRSALSCLCFIFAASSLPEQRREVITPKMIITVVAVAVGCVLYQMPGNPFPHCKSLWQPSIVVAWSGGRSIVSGMHRLIGQGGRARVGGVFGRLTALPPPTPPQLSCLIRIRGIHKGCFHDEGTGVKKWT